MVSMDLARFAAIVLLACGAAAAASCDPNSVKVSGNGNSVSVTGNGQSVSITGNGNRVTIENSSECPTNATINGRSINVPPKSKLELTPNALNLGGVSITNLPSDDSAMFRAGETLKTKQPAVSPEWRELSDVPASDNTLSEPANVPGEDASRSLAGLPGPRALAKYSSSAVRNILTLLEQLEELTSLRKDITRGSLIAKKIFGFGLEKEHIGTTAANASPETPPSSTNNDPKETPKAH